jgi:hypothetical protein
VLVLAGLAEGVVVGVEGGAPEVYGAAEYVAGGGVYLLRLFGGEGVGPAGRVDAGGEEDLVYVDVAEAGDDRLVEEEALYVRLSPEGPARYSTVNSSENGSGRGGR